MALDANKLKAGDTFVGPKTGKTYRVLDKDEAGNLTIEEVAPAAKAPAPEFDIPEFGDDPVERFLLPEKPHEYPNYSAAVKTVGDGFEAAGEAVKGMGREMLRNPATTAAAFVPGLGPLASALAMGAGQVADRFVVPFARAGLDHYLDGGKVLEPARFDADIPDTLEEVNEAAGEAALTMAGGALFPNKGGVSFMPDSVGPETITLNGGKTQIQAQKPGMLPVKHVDGKGPLSIGEFNAAKGTELTVEPGDFERWSGVSIVDFPHDAPGVLNESEVADLGREGMRRLKIPQASPAQMGSKTAKAGEEMIASSVGKGKIDERNVLQEAVLDNRAAAEAGENAFAPQRAAEPIVERAKTERDLVRGLRADNEVVNAQGIQDAEGRLTAAKGDFEQTVARLSSPDVPPEVAGARLKSATEKFVNRVQEEQANIRNEALTNYRTKDLFGAYQAAIDTENAFRQVLENNKVRFGEDGMPSTIGRGHITKMDPRYIGELRDIVAENQIGDLPPADLELLRQRVGGMLSRSMAALPEDFAAGGRGKFETTQGLKALYDKLKDVQMAMFDETGQKLIKEADDRFQKNLDVLEALGPVMDPRMVNQSVPRLLFGASKVETQRAAKKVAPKAFELVRQARQADLIQASGGDVETLNAKVRALGGDTAKFFHLEPITDQLLEKTRAVESAAASVDQAKTFARQWGAFDKAVQQQFEQTIGSLPGLRNNNVNAADVIDVFGSGNVGKVDLLFELAERAENPAAFEELRKVWLYNVFRNSRTYREFENNLYKAGPETMEKYFDAPGYVELTNNFRLMAATRDNILASVKHRSRGSKSEQNNPVFGFVIGPLLGRVLASKPGSAFFDGVAEHLAPAAIGQGLRDAARVGATLETAEIPEFAEEERF